MGRHTLLNDIVFKIVFGTEQNRHLLRALLNALLGLSDKRRIVDLEILNPVVDKVYLKEKGTILDVKARDGQGCLYNIEVQVGDEPAYILRALYYLAQLFAGQLDRGADYESLAKTIGISLLDFNLFPYLTDLHSTYRFYDSIHGRELTDVLEIHFIELVKFRKDKPQLLWSPFEKWLHVLKFAELYETDLEAVPEALKAEEGIDMALDAMKRAYASDEVRELIEFRKKALNDEATRMARARRQGLAEGRAEGRAEGIEQGKVVGKAVGLQEAARKLLEQGMDRETVLRMLGLPPETLP